MFDRTAPVINGFVISGDDQNGFILSRQTNESAKYTVNYAISGNPAVTVTGTTYGTSFIYLINGITISKTCSFQLNVLDHVGNATQFSGSIDVSNDGIVSFDYSTLGSTLALMDTGSIYT